MSKERFDSILSALGEPYFSDGKRAVYHGRVEEVLAKIPAGVVDSIVTDPPYAEIDRPYGRLTEADWHALMRIVVAESRRVLTPTGSAVYILQPNSERVGRMRPWLWEFMAWTAREWNQVQDAWWWNHATPPTVHCHEKNGLLRPSMKACVWLGDAKCYRDQNAALIPISKSQADLDRHDMGLRVGPSGLSRRPGRFAECTDRRGGATPFNVVVCANTDSSGSAGAKGHGAGTPMPLATWWLRYITPDNGLTLEPFCGSGTMLEAARNQNLYAVGIEKEEAYCRIAAERLSKPQGVLDFAEA